MAASAASLCKLFVATVAARYAGFLNRQTLVHIGTCYIRCDPAATSLQSNSVIDQLFTGDLASRQNLPQATVLVLLPANTCALQRAGCCVYVSCPSSTEYGLHVTQKHTYTHVTFTFPLSAPHTSPPNHRIDMQLLVSTCQARPVTDSIPAAPEQCSVDLRKQTRWGVATASYQVEGGWNLGGRTPSVWDTFSHDGFIKNNDTGKFALLLVSTEKISRLVVAEQNWLE